MLISTSPGFLIKHLVLFTCQQQRLLVLREVVRAEAIYIERDGYDLCRLYSPVVVKYYSEIHFKLEVKCRPYSERSIYLS